MASITKIDGYRQMALAFLKMKDEGESELFNRADELILRAACPRYCFSCLSVKLGENEAVLGDGEMRLYSKTAVKHLEGFSKAAVICVTLGDAVDKAILRESVGDLALAVVMDAVSSAMAERSVQIAQSLIGEELGVKSFGFRFSPGYGDLGLEHQRRILSITDANRRIGLCLGEADILLPRKSVTAIVGMC